MPLAADVGWPGAIVVALGHVDAGLINGNDIAHRCTNLIHQLINKAHEVLHIIALRKASTGSKPYRQREVKQRHDWLQPSIGQRGEVRLVVFDRLGIPRALFWLDARPLHTKAPRGQAHLLGQGEVLGVELGVVGGFARDIIVWIFGGTGNVRPVGQVAVLILALSSEGLGLSFFPLRPLVVHTTLDLMRARRSAPEEMFWKLHRRLLLSHNAYCTISRGLRKIELLGGCIVFLSLRSLHLPALHLMACENRLQ